MFCSHLGIVRIIYLIEIDVEHLAVTPSAEEADSTN